MNLLKNLLNGILESSKESVVFALDYNYCYLTFNENHRKTMKNIWNADIKIGDNILDFITYQEDRNKAKANFDRTLRGESFTVFEEYGDLSIDRRWYQNEYNPLYDESGTVIGLTVCLIDITEHKQAENALQKSEEKFRSYTENAPIGICVVDSVGQIIDVNPEICKMRGYTKDELLDKQVQDIVHPDYRQRARENLKIVEETGSSKDTILGLKKDGSSYWFDLYAVKINDDLYMSFQTDVTERVVRKNKLQENEEKFRTLFEQNMLGIYLHDFDGNIIDVNKEACSQLGYDHEVLQNMSVFDFVRTKEFGGYLTRQEILNIWNQMELGDRTTVEDMHQRKDGSVIYVEVSTGVVKYNNQKVIMALIKDITDRKKAEERLKEREALLREYFDKTPAGINIINQNGDYLDANYVSTQVLGYSKEELLEYNIFDFVEAQYHKMLKNWLPQLEEGGYVSGEVMLSVKNDEKKWAEIHAVKLDKDRILTFSLDISERKQAEEKIQYMNIYDRLTGLYNRGYFEEKLQSFVKEKELPVHIIMADINGLKLINDTYGSEVGDEILKKAAEILKSSCSDNEVIARWGDDEFVVLKSKSNQKDLQAICHRIKEKSKNLYIKNIPLSLALGVGTKEDTNKKLTETIKEAENSMNREKLAESQSAKNSVLQALIKTLQTKSNETERHTQRMLIVALEIGERLGLSESELNRLQLVVTLHDIGKINISEHTLTKKERLTDEEWEEIKKHPELGYKIARGTEEFSHVAEDILSHHEKWDGKGYPRGLKGNGIPLLARITAIADAYEVMSNGRPYKEPMSEDAIIAEFKRCSGTQFDPRLTEVFIEVLEEQRNI